MNSRSVNVAKTIGKEIANSFDLSSKKVLEKFDSLEIELLEQGFDVREATEIKRRIAEAKVAILFNRIGDKDEMERAWNDIELTGYSTKEREASILFYYAKYLIKNRSDRSLITTIIDRLGNLTEEFKIQESQEKLAEHFANVHESLLTDLDHW